MFPPIPPQPPNRAAFYLPGSGCPVYLPSNGTVDASGNITLVTALNAIYADGLWLRLPAGAIVGGAAGMYYCVMSSTTVGVVKTNFIDPVNGFIPKTPSGTLVNAIGSGSAYTQTTAAEITLISVPYTAGITGANGTLFCSAGFGQNNTAGTKVSALRINGTLVRNRSRTTITADGFAGTIRCINSKTRQFSNLVSGNTDPLTGSVPFYDAHTLDLSVSSYITITAQIAVATDYLGVLFFSFSGTYMP